MAIAQMNWGRLRFPLSDPRMAEFEASLGHVYQLAEAHNGFVWRVPDDEAASQLQDLNFGEGISATVSVWKTVEDLKNYTFGSPHGDYIDRKNEWFDSVEGPQLVIWNVVSDEQPTFKEAFDRLEILKRDGPTKAAFSWPDYG